MAVLSDARRLALSALFQSDVSSRRETFAALTKADVRAAVNALDDWVNSMASTINSAIPQPARAQLTTTQKAEILKRILEFRYQDGA